MKETREFPRVRTLSGRVKRFFVIASAIVMTFAFSATALANKGGAQPKGADAVSGATQKDKSNKSGGKQNSKPKAKISAPDVKKIEDAIAALTDEAEKAELSALLSAYQDAWKAKQDAIAANDTSALDALTSAITAAKTALDVALNNAGISQDTIKGKPVAALDGAIHANRRPTLDTEEILAAISTLDDTNADKATLTSLLDAYKLALAAKQAANTATMNEAELQALAYALRNAEEALLLASREAGLIGGLGRGQFISGYAFGNAKLDLTAILASIASLDDADANKATLTALYEAYYAAMLAETTADKAALSDAEFDALHDATKTAQTALVDALKLAGIEAPLLKQEAQATSSSGDDDDDDDDEDEEDHEDAEEDDD
jgi:hypothetical protein